MEMFAKKAVWNMNLSQRKGVHLAAGVIAELCVGIVYAWSVFQNPLVERFGWTTSAVSVAFIIATCMGALSPLVGKLQEYMQTKTIVLIGGVVYGICLVLTGYTDSLAALYIYYGVGVGLGTTMIYPLVISYMVKIFPEKRGLASGLMVAGYGSGAIVWAPVGACLTEAFGVLNAFKLMGIGLFILIAAASRFIGDGRSVNPGRADHSLASVENRNDKNWREMLATPIFWVIFSAIAIGATSGLMILAHASPIVQSTLNLPPQGASFIVGVLSAANAFGRLVLGGISDRVGRYPLLISMFVMSIASFYALIEFSYAPVFLAAVIIIEVCFGGYISLIAPITADVFGARHIDINYGIMFITLSIGGIVGPRLAAVVKETHGGSYHQAYVIALAMCIAGLALAILALIKTRKPQPACGGRFPVVSRQNVATDMGRNC